VVDGEWHDYIALLGLVNMLDIPVAVVSSLGEEGLNKRKAYDDCIAVRLA